MEADLYLHDFEDERGWFFWITEEPPPPPKKSSEDTDDDSDEDEDLDEDEDESDEGDKDGEDSAGESVEIDFDLLFAGEESDNGVLMGTVTNIGRKVEQRFPDVSSFLNLTYSPIELQRRLSQEPTSYQTLNVDFEASRQLAEHGWPEGVERINRIKTRLHQVMAGRIRLPEVHYDVTGDMLDVGRWVNGEPEDFMTLVDSAIEVNTKPPKIVKIVATVDITDGPEAAITRGAAIAALTQLLELHGIRVQIDLHVGSNRIIDTWIRAKEAEWPVNIENLAFLLAHPVVFHKLIMSAWEHLDEKTRERCGGLGTRTWGYISEPASEDQGDVYVSAIQSRWIHSEETILRWVTEQLVVHSIVVEVGV